ncbi:hypothetical protein J7E43_08435 [Bacillus sp. ISL-8]|nr:hypothetical protein [Bacillus sp. ISL-8]
MNEEKKYFNKAKCLVCGHMDKVYHPSKEEYQEVTVCPKCNGAFVDVWVINNYKRQSNDTKKNIQGLTIELNVETTEALKGIKEVTKAANECVAAVEKLEKVMTKFNIRNEVNELVTHIPIHVDGKIIARSTHNYIRSEHF